MVDTTSSSNPDQPSSPKLPEFSEKIENALREGGRQIRFDDIEKRYKGKRVWVLDREKMQRGVMRVVDEAIRYSQQAEEGGLVTRQRVAQAIAKMFGNNRNITSPVDPQQVAAARKAQAAGATAKAPPSLGGDAPADMTLDQQIARLTGVIDRAESALTRLAASAGRFGSSSSDNRGLRRRAPVFERSGEHDQVLAEIFKTNLELRKGLVPHPPTAN